MTFYETDVFITERIVDLIDDESYSELQGVLVADSEAGDLIPRSRELRKIRWRVRGRGKRGGIRVINDLVEADEIFMLYACSKHRREDISPAQARILRGLVDEHLRS